MRLTKESIGKPFKLRDGTKAYILSYEELEPPAFFRGAVLNGSNWEGANWSPDGSTPYNPQLDIVCEWREPRTGEGWVNVYSDGATECYSTEKAAYRYGGTKCIARARYHWTEGQFD